MSLTGCTGFTEEPQLLAHALQDTPAAVTVGEATRILVYAADAFGNRLQTTTFAALLTASSTGASVSVSDISPGVAVLHITASGLGALTVDLQLSGVSIRGAPLALQAQSALTPDISKTVAWGSLLGVCCPT
jgi:hypothetical protein